MDMSELVRISQITGAVIALNQCQVEIVGTDSFPRTVRLTYQGMAFDKIADEAQVKALQELLPVRPAFQTPRKRLKFRCQRVSTLVRLRT